MKKVFLIHGWGGVPEGGWRPWLKSQLEQRSFKVVVPAMPNPDYPKVDEWVNRIAHLVGMMGGPNDDFILVGHSLGCTGILRYLETLAGQQEVGGAVLVAGPAEYNGIEDFKNFFSEPFRWAEIKKHCKKFIAINSDNDPYIPFGQRKIYEEKLGAELIVKRGHGHFSGDEGFTELPAALEAVLKIAASK